MIPGRGYTGCTRSWTLRTPIQNLYIRLLKRNDIVLECVREDNIVKIITIATVGMNAPAKYKSEHKPVEYRLEPKDDVE